MQGEPIYDLHVPMSASVEVRVDGVLPGGEAATAERMLGSAAVAYIRARGLYGAAPADF